MAESHKSLNLTDILVQANRSEEIFDNLTTEQRANILANPKNFPRIFIESVREGTLKPGIILSLQAGRLMVAVAKEG